MPCARVGMLPCKCLAEPCRHTHPPAYLAPCPRRLASMKTISGLLVLWHLLGLDREEPWQQTRGERSESRLCISSSPSLQSLIRIAVSLICKWQSPLDFPMRFSPFRSWPLPHSPAGIGVAHIPYSHPEWVSFYLTITNLWHKQLLNRSSILAHSHRDSSPWSAPPLLLSQWRSSPSTWELVV